MGKSFALNALKSENKQVMCMYNEHKPLSSRVLMCEDWSCWYSGIVTVVTVPKQAQRYQVFLRQIKCGAQDCISKAQQMHLNMLEALEYVGDKIVIMTLR